jgi:hypothetical protein
VAARIRRELKIEVDAVHGRFGEYRILVDGDVVVDGGPMVALGMMPRAAKSVDAVRQRLGA